MSDQQAGAITDTLTWQTYTNLEEFYSIKYPDLGTLVVEYSAVPRGTTLGWEGVGDFDIGIATIQPNGVKLHDWLWKNEHIDVARSKPGEIERTSINGMDCVIVFDPQVQRISAYLEQDFHGVPLIHTIDFSAYAPGVLSPPFWNAMLHTFRGLPEQP